MDTSFASTPSGMKHNFAQFLLGKDFWVHNFIDEIKEDYLLIYDFDSNKELKKTALKIAKEKGFKIYALNKNIRYGYTKSLCYALMVEVEVLFYP